MVMVSCAVFVARRQYAGLMDKWYDPKYDARRPSFLRTRKPSRHVHERNAVLVAAVVFLSGFVAIGVGLAA